MLSAFIDSKSFPRRNFPFLTLLISGGHTQIILAKQIGQYELLVKLLMTQSERPSTKSVRNWDMVIPVALYRGVSKKGGSLQTPLPKTSFKKQGLNFSFSGLKTAVIREIIKCKTSKDRYWQNNIAASLQNTISMLLASKIRDAITLTVLIHWVSGVAANHYIRETLSNLCQAMQVKLRLLSETPVCR